MQTIETYGQVVLSLADVLGWNSVGMEDLTPAVVTKDNNGHAYELHLNNVQNVRKAWTVIRFPCSSFPSSSARALSASSALENCTKLQE